MSLRRSPATLRRLRTAAAMLGWALAAAAQAAPACPTDAAWIAQRVSEVRSLGALCGQRGEFPAAGPVQWNPVLQEVAQRHAAFLVQVGRLQHTGAMGERVGERAHQAGYSYFRVGENLAHGQRSLDAALRDWTASDAHCAALFHPAYEEAAVACLPARDGRPVWVLVLGRQATTVAGLQQASWRR